MSNPKKERVDFVQSVHDYLSKNGFCSVNDGEFLLWSMDVLYDYSNNCEICKESEEMKDAQATTANSENNTENSNNDDTEASTSNKANEKSKSKKSTGTNLQVNSKKSSHCVTCEDVITELLEQSFLCCFGYKTKGNKHLKNHSVINIKYTLDNCKHLYNYYRPEKLPEYDDLPFKSITSEVVIFYLKKLNIDQLFNHFI